MNIHIQFEYAGNDAVEFFAELRTHSIKILGGEV